MCSRVCASGNTLEVFRDVEICLIERRLDDRRVLGKDLTDLLADGPIDLEARFYEDQIGTLSFARNGRHRRAHGEFAGFVARCSHDPALPADDHRFAAKLWIIPLFDGRVKGVHVDINNLTLSDFRRDVVRHRAVGFHLLSLIASIALATGVDARSAGPSAAA